VNDSPVDGLKTYPVSLMAMFFFSFIDRIFYSSDFHAAIASFKKNLFIIRFYCLII